MDGNRDEAERGHSTRFARPKSRGVSTTTPQPAHDALSITAGSSSVTITTRPAGSYSPRDAPRCLSQRHQSGPSDEPAPGEEPKGPIPMAGGSNPSQGSPGAAQQDGDSVTAHQHHGEEHSAPFPGTEFGISRHFSRPPPPPPLTPPTLDSTFFPFEHRRPSDAVSIPPSFDSSFIHQPNPEYGAASNPLDSPNLSSSPPTAAGTLPRLTSYTRSVPVGMPGLTTTASAASSSNETMTSGSTTASSFSPSSYPQASPLLPPPPPGQFEPPMPRTTSSGPSAPPKYQFVGGPGGPGVLLSQHEIDLQGEVISVVDDAGHGWKRHTRVYGGGVCLACVAAQRRGEGRGGFYGDKVPLEDRR
ncbi:uncharacterized protein C8A04DRAFT_32293 [Dichotomopilus funicola]|uniref:Uncharacterized protein n=1 Tax=Dichotomopilus funicola TaxID=1934379 RepID=A0AAN6ZIY5_9PEZI|nr:hypothetical protein C8A04DRAFT_32293 [Dichotomopilus funicola]